MFYLAINRVQTGPLTEADVHQRLAAGTVAPSDLCWQEGWPEWKKVGDVFAPPVPPVVAVAPPPLPGEPPVLGAPVATGGLVNAGVKPTCGWAVASLVCGLGVFVLFPFFFLLAPAAIICGHVAKAKIRRSGRSVGGNGLALTGLVLGYGGGALLLALSTAIGVFAYRHWHRESEETVIRSHLSLFWSASEQKLLETDAASVTYDDVVGPGKALAESDLAPVAGEDYRTLVVHQGDESLSITLGDGNSVEFYAESPAGSTVTEPAEDSDSETDEPEVAKPEAGEPEDAEAPQEEEKASPGNEPATPEAIPEPAKDPEAFLGRPAPDLA